ncbi:MAG: hypothetical protein ABIN01_14185 [Ferruginibacter sp.]
MKQIVWAGGITFLLLLFTTLPNNLRAQSSDCILKDPIFTMDFGTDHSAKEVNLSSLRNYEQIDGTCPNDGYFSYVSETSDCYDGHWITLPQDHTPNDVDGKMLLVNASYTAGTFFIMPITELKSNTTYELATFMVNVSYTCYSGPPISPAFNFVIENENGQKLASLVTGELKPTQTALWIKVSGRFTTPANVGTVMLRIINKIRGGCGNDFAMDDITIRECVFKQVTKETPKPIVKNNSPVTKPVVTVIPTVVKPVKKNIPVLTKAPINNTPLSRPLIKQPAVIDLPKVILTRANPIIKQIETPKAEVVIDLYDNGEIDGDTVSIYHNNVLIVSRVGLSEKPVTFRLSVDEAHPLHEVVMVANNLGSIPPNTSLMIVTARDKRYEVFISSSEQKNAKVVISLKE